MSPDASAPPLLFLKPCEIVLSCEPMVVTTLLGSCVAVTMFSARLRLGAICHALLPSCGQGQPCSHGEAEAGRYVACAIRLMLDQLKARGVARRDIEAKLFGGSDMFETAVGRGLSVGGQNIKMALWMLELESVRLVTQDLGGPRGRKIVFHTHTGEVFLKRLRKSEI